MRVRLLGVVVATAVFVAGCGTAGDENDVTAPPPPSPTSEPEPEPEPELEPEPEPGPEPLPSEDEAIDPPPVPAGYELIAGESGVAPKQAAIAFVETLTTYDRGESLEEVVGRVTEDPDLAARLLEVAAPLHRDDAWSRGQIVYPQLGGLLLDSAAVITVVRQELLLEDGSTRTQTRVLDVRVRRAADEAWRVSDLVSAGGNPVARPDDLSAAAEAVLDDDRIELPDTARWDIHAGRVDEVLLELMARMADRSPYGVVVFKTGHSREVFGTDRDSRHFEGRAVDLYRIGDRHVIEDRDRGSHTYEFVWWLYDQPELAQVGSPWRLDAFGGRSFTDEVHLDHIHVAVLRAGEVQRSAPAS